MPDALFEAPAACDVILWIVEHRPGITETELAQAMFGMDDMPRLITEISLLEGKGLISRERSASPREIYRV